MPAERFTQLGVTPERIQGIFPGNGNSYTALCPVGEAWLIYNVRFHWISSADVLARGVTIQCRDVLGKIVTDYPALTLSAGTWAPTGIAASANFGFNGEELAEAGTVAYIFDGTLFRLYIYIKPFFVLPGETFWIYGNVIHANDQITEISYLIQKFAA